MLAPRAIHLVVLLVSAVLLPLSCSVKPNFVNDTPGGNGGTGPIEDGGADTGTPCTTANDCPGADSACSNRACVSSQCAPEFTPRGTVLPMQEQGDCRATVCDGSGHEISQLNALDAPVDINKGDCKRPACNIDGSFAETIDDTDTDDGDPCTEDICSQGEPTHSPRPDNFTCGDCLKCLQGACVACMMACTAGPCTDV
jgi:hypothetical protein